MLPIILASQSPRRKELLTAMGLSFEVVSSDYEEDMTLPLAPLELAKVLSKGKAEAVADKFPAHLIIAADTFVVLGDEILGKPGTSERATEMLNKISGQTLSVITGVTVLETESGESKSESLESKVHMKRFTSNQIKTYVATGEPLDKAGAFAIQGEGASLIDSIEGDFNNIVGLPTTLLADMLKSLS
jgi:septum formation protein